MKKGIIIILVLMFTVSWAFAEGTKPEHGPTVIIQQAEIGGRAVGDDCTDPIIISIPADLPYSDLAQTTCGRGNSYSDTPLGGYDGGEDIIYRLDVTADIFLDFEMIPDVTWTGLLVADDCPDVGAEVAMSTASSGSHLIEGVELLAGNSYYVMMDTWPTPDCIPALDFNIVEGTPPPPPPDNDTCETAEVIGEVTDYAFDTTLATTSGFDTNSINQDIWYSYTPASDGTITVDLCDSSFDTKLAIYETCDVATELGYNDDNTGYCETGYVTQSAILDLPVVSGEDYLIQVGGYGSNSGIGDLTIVLTSSFVMDPPINVIVDDETGTISWLTPLETIIEDDFDGFTTGDYIAVVGDNWTTWSDDPGGSEDAYVTDAQSSSPSNSVLVEENDDLVFLMDEYTTGKYSYDMKMYVPTGYCGYFNVLQDFAAANSIWGFQIFFKADGIAEADANGAAALTYDFNHDEWMDLKVIVDLDNDWATFYHNGEEMVGYQWTLGCFGDPGILQLGAANIYGGAGPNNPSDTPLFYIDDIVLSELQDVTGFNVYLDGSLEDTVGDDVTEYMYLDLVEDQTYTAGVSALYVDGESDIVEIEFTYNPDTSFDPPSNPAAVVDDYNDVIITWEQPSGSSGDWLSYHDDTFEGGLCSTDGGAGIAQMFQPTAYPCTIEQIEYFVTSEGSNGQEIETWIISDNGSTVLGGPYTTNVVLEWNTVDIDDIVITSGGFMIATYNVLAGGPFTGYDTDTYDGTLYFGNHTGGFTELGEYNYFGTGSHGAYVAYSRDSDIVAKHQILKPAGSSEKTVSRSLVTESNPFDCIQTIHIRDTRSLAGFKVFRDGSEIADITDPTALTYTDESLNAGTYEYTLMAYYTNPDGESILTDPVDATVVLDCPTNVNAQFQAPNVIVTWSAPARGIDYYNIYRDGALHEEEVSGLMFIDIGVPAGTYMYSATTVFEGGWESDPCDEVEVTVTSGDGILKPTVTELTGNYPNPFNPTTTINFSLKEAGHVSINIYNMRGQLVKTLVNAELDRNFHNIVWDGKDNSGKNTSSGVYFYKMKAQNYNSTKKMILMK